MDIPGWVPPDMRWMFWDKAEANDAISSGKPWTEREDYYLSKFYPCHWKLRIFIPERSPTAYRKRARRIGIVRAPFDRWSYEESVGLKINTPNCHGAKLKTAYQKDLCTL